MPTAAAKLITRNQLSVGETQSATAQSISIKPILQQHTTTRGVTGPIVPVCQLMHDSGIIREFQDGAPEDSETNALPAMLSQ